MNVTAVPTAMIALAAQVCHVSGRAGVMVVRNTATAVSRVAPAVATTRAFSMRSFMGVLFSSVALVDAAAKVGPVLGGLGHELVDGVVEDPHVGAEPARPVERQGTVEQLGQVLVEVVLEDNRRDTQSDSQK